MSHLILHQSLISPQFLAENLTAENLVLLDASMKPVNSTGVKVSNEPVYVPRTLRFDYDTHLCDHSSPLPHMMPSAGYFTEELQKMGINQDSAIVVYDNIGVYASPRAWWMLRVMGHRNVAVLNGGLPAWVQAGHPTCKTLAAPKVRGNFVANVCPGWSVGSQEVAAALKDPACCVVDARSAGRFEGREPEPRPGLRGGHMPGAVNLPYTDVLNGGILHDSATVRAAFGKYRGKRLIFSCGTGVTACIVALAADQAGIDNLSVQDGSWTKWGRLDSGLPVIEGNG